MTTRTDYTTADWTALLNVPLLAGTYVCLATVNGLNMPQEVANLLHAIDTQPAPAVAAERKGWLLPLADECGAGHPSVWTCR